MSSASIKIDDRKDCILRIIESVTEMYHMMGSSRDKMLATLGVNKPQLELLMLLKDSSLNIKSAARKLQVTSASVTQLVNHLEHGGLVERVNKDLDKRCAYIQMTEAGKKHFKVIKKAYVRRIERLLVDVDDELLFGLESLTGNVLGAISESEQK